MMKHKIGTHSDRKSQKHGSIITAEPPKHAQIMGVPSPGLYHISAHISQTIQVLIMLLNSLIKTGLPVFKHKIEQDGQDKFQVEFLMHTHYMRFYNPSK